MFIGHYAVGLASKKFAPRTSLGVLIAAPILLDLLWPIFLALGWEQVAVVSSTNPFLRFEFISYPISHGLVAVIGWATLFAALYFGFTRYVAGAVTIWIGVVSHWLLDYVVHLPDLPLYSGGKLVGLGLWGHRWNVVAIELAMLALGILLYVLQTKAKDAIGDLGFWALIAALVGVYAFVVFGSRPPQSTKAIIIATLSMAIVIPWAWWLDQHRELRAPD